MIRLFGVILLVITLTIVWAQKVPNSTVNYIDLSGEWNYRLDRDDVGSKQRWFSQRFEGKLQLPGSLTTNNIGDDVTVNTPWIGSIMDSSYFKKDEYKSYREPGNIKVPFWLQPVKYYKGAAWYQKTIDVPAHWNQSVVEVFIERAHWETTLWIDTMKIGMQNSLAAPHQYILKNSLKPGKHTITIRVDNRVKDISVGQNSHSISDHTQSNWNGMIGRLEVRARPNTYLSDVKVYPDLAGNKVLVKAVVTSAATKKVNSTISTVISASGKSYNAISKSIVLVPGKNEIQIEYPITDKALAWSEFTPSLYKLHIALSSGKVSDTKVVQFGMRQVSKQGTQFTINNTPVFLRGTLECAIFPKTGYPPTTEPEWIRIFNTVKSFGLNHVRFHSWCPPEAAFHVADSLGVYLQIECSSWANQGTELGDGAPVDQYIYDESNRIVDAYGNHPSFCFMAYGNEPSGKNHQAYLTTFVNYWKAKDARRQYTAGAGWPALDVSDYHNLPEPRIQHWGEGVNSVINKLPPSFDYDWTRENSKWKIPTVSHEIGQWCVYPDFKEISEYDGVLKPKNFEIFRETLASHGMLALADSFLLASGKLQTLCYKADIEAALRTKNFGGFQLLDLHDFPGQGTALVGVLSPFWKEKGYVTAEEYSMFCNRIVPLAKFQKMVFLNSESLDIPVEIANFSGQSITDGTVSWQIKDKDGKAIYSGSLPEKVLPVGNGIAVGNITQSLADVKRESMFTLQISIGRYTNQWDFFVYPAALSKIDTSKIVIADRLDKKTIDQLQRGGTVLLSLKKGTIKPEAGGDIAIGFSSIFWNTAWTSGQAPHTLGILCNPQHPAFEMFPTQYHSNWQWWDAMSHSTAIRLDLVDKNIKPIVRVIDDWVTARPLGLVFECKVGKGKLLVSSIDLTSDMRARLEARQLRHSLLNYMAGKSFNPVTQVSIDKIQALLKQ
jgi:hypothetical protein